MDRCHLSPGVACRPQDGPAAGIVGRGCVRARAASRGQIGLEQGSRAGVPGRQAPRNRVAADSTQNRSQNEPQAAWEKPGCERGLMTCWCVRLVDGGREAASQGLSRTLGSWSQEQAGHIPGGGGKEWRQLAGARRAKEACPRAVLFSRGQAGKCSGSVGARWGAGWLRRKGSPPSKEAEASSHGLSGRQQIQQLDCLRSISRKLLRLLSLQAGDQAQSHDFLRFVTCWWWRSVDSGFSPSREW